MRNCHLNPILLFVAMAALIVIQVFPCYATTIAALAEPDGFVTDQAGILRNSEISELTDICVDPEASTTCELAIVIIDTTENQTIEWFAKKLFNKWGVGKAEINNGVMILIALDDRAWRVQVGLGLESILTTDLLTDIMEDTAVPEFSQGNYAQGLIDAAEEIGSVLESEFDADE